MRVVSNSYTMVCPPVQEILHSLKLVDYLLVKVDKPGITITHNIGLPEEF